MAITEIRILPPLAIARFGSSPEPLDNFELVVDEKKPLDFRRICPAETLVVAADGSIAKAHTPTEIRFKDDAGAIRPVAPFLEVWARTSEEVLEPLTVELLKESGLSASDVQWSVSVANIKAYRRTEAEADRIFATAGPFSDHTIHELSGTCDNFVAGKSIPLGSVQFIRPTDAFPQIRLRFTPAHGKVYGPAEDAPADEEKKKKRIVADEVYKTDGPWNGWFEIANPVVDPRLTSPANIFWGADATDKGQSGWKSKGFLDDACDGFVEARLTVKDAHGEDVPLTSFARIGSGPPTFAPDSLPVRTVADDLEQALLGPEVEAKDVSAKSAEDTVRRALETFRLMNTAVMNGNIITGQQNVASTMVRQDTNDFARLHEPIMAPSLVDNLAVRALHESVFAALRSKTAPWFASVLRRYDEIGDLTTLGRRKMPALMRGADARHLALTRRQVDMIDEVAKARSTGVPDVEEEGTDTDHVRTPNEVTAESP